MSEQNRLTLPAQSIAYEKLLTESEAIAALGLTDRPKPGGALRWLIRTRKLGCVRLGRGIIRFRPADIAACIERNHRRAK